MFDEYFLEHGVAVKTAHRHDAGRRPGSSGDQAGAEVDDVRRLLPDHFPEPVECFRFERVVGVKAHDIAAAGGGDAAETGRERAAVLRMGHDAEPRIARRIIRQNPGGVVRRGVVDGHDFDIGMGLGEQVVQRTREQGSGFVDRNQDGDVRLRPGRLGRIHVKLLCLRRPAGRGASLRQLLCVS